MMDTNIDNAVFMSLAFAPRTRQRLKGYYVCFNCGEFIRNIPLKQVKCPFCNNECSLLCRLDSAQEYLVHERWEQSGICSQIRKGVTEA